MTCEKCLKEKTIEEMRGPLWKSMCYPNYCTDCYVVAAKDEDDWRRFVSNDNPFLKKSKDETSKS